MSHSAPRSAMESRNEGITCGRAPDLMLGGAFAMGGAEVGELVEQPLAPFGLKLREEHARGEVF